MLMGIKGRDYIRTVFTGSDFGLSTYFLITHPTSETVKAHEALNMSLIFDSANVGHFKEIVTKMNYFLFIIQANITYIIDRTIFTGLKMNTCPVTV